MLQPLVESEEEHCEPIIVDGGSFKWTAVLWFFSTLGFPSKNQVLMCLIICIILLIV